MPLFYQHNINEDERIGVWKIEENEDFFLSKVPANRNITHEHKRLQHLAGRYLLQQLFPDFPYELIQIADTRKPFLFNEAYHFSISHCDNFAAALVSRWRRVGVDIEVVTPTIGKIKHKFLNDFEITLLEHQAISQEVVTGSPILEPSGKRIMQPINEEPANLHSQQFSDNMHEKISRTLSGNHGQTTDQLALFTLCWSAKEAMYKWYGNGAVDFKNHMHLVRFHDAPEEGWTLTDFLFQKEKPAPLVLRSRFIGDAVLTYVIS